jgi:RNA polymerase sigma factor (sigma-70 family)
MKRLLAVYRIPADDAQDVVQQTLLALLYQWEKIRDPECWVLGTLKRHCLMYWRTQRRRLYSAVDAAILEWLSQPVAPAQERADLVADLESVIEKLPPRCQSLLKLRFRLGYEPPEVAAKMGYRASSIGKITTRCLAALSREMMAAGITADALQGTCGSPAASPEPEAPDEPDTRSRTARAQSRR